MCVEGHLTLSTILRTSNRVVLQIQVLCFGLPLHHHIGPSFPTMAPFSVLIPFTKYFLVDI